MNQKLENQINFKIGARPQAGLWKVIVKDSLGKVSLVKARLGYENSKVFDPKI